MISRNEREFKENFFTTEGIYSSDYSPYEPGVNVPNRPDYEMRVEDTYSSDTRYIDFVKNMSPMSYADKSKPKVIKHLSTRFKENNDLGGAIYYMTLNVGYDWMRQHNLLTASGFKVTRQQIKALVYFCLTEYKKRRQSEMLSHLK